MQPAQVGSLCSAHLLRGYAVFAGGLSVVGKPLVKFLSNFRASQNSEGKLGIAATNRTPGGDWGGDWKLRTKN